jgi:hypothetical protein
MIRKFRIETLVKLRYRAEISPDESPKSGLNLLVFRPDAWFDRGMW